MEKSDLVFKKITSIINKYNDSNILNFQFYLINSFQIYAPNDEDLYKMGFFENDNGKGVWSDKTLEIFSNDTEKIINFSPTVDYTSEISENFLSNSNELLEF